ncbi:pyridoxal phosphate-dependent transferase [Truncatella angustata]|uniref:Pyridoxal phosphate-dependent transferase n=1 Tax=Truncatella angustata TaxID=152316 RepID=A0A9P8UEM0_9PEZI|nr:pyridoxal phosphate-dependent transferase [Truncatella angustata]KAH6648507.1 pyridoxal phosphate-dependent transferase [Truncatella angustata]
MAHEESTPSGTSYETPATRLQHLSLSSQTIHADDYLNMYKDVAPAMHVSTTFRYSRNPDELKQWNNENPVNPYNSHIYSRDSAPNSTRLEAILTSILHGPSLTYSSGLSAFHAMLVHLNPKRIAIGGGYHGCHGVIKLLSKLTGLQMVDLDCPDSELGKGDVLHVETPLNPTGEARNLEFYRKKADRTGAWLTIDATFAPPPLLDPFLWGADVVMHSGTKYFGGHSDMLCGVLAMAPKHSAWIEELRDERLVLGSVLGSLEGWLGVRSLRTLEIRVKKQSHDAEKLVQWLTSELQKDGSLVSKLVKEVNHASLQKQDLEGENAWLKQQMPNGFGPVFSFLFKEGSLAKRLPSKLHLFQHATSLGGVESLIEWRAMSDKSCDKRLLRVSVGIEGWEDLRDDLVQGFEALSKESTA